MPREMLIHLNVEADDSETRTADEIADALLARIGEQPGLVIVAPLAEEV